MNTEHDRRLEALFAAARANPTDTGSAEFAFETRLLARIQEERSTSVFCWAWKLAPYFAALALAAGWWLWNQSTESEWNVLAEIIHSHPEELAAAFFTDPTP
jgi:hypothetical protein